MEQSSFIRRALTASALTRGALMGFAALLLAACASTPAPSLDVQQREAEATLMRFLENDPSLQAWVDGAYGYAIFPDISKGGFGFGGGFGRGLVFEQGRVVGRTQVTQATFGAQIGVQSYSQVIFFRDEAALRTYQRENFEFSAQAAAVAATAGAAATTSYERGVAVFILTRSGLMAEATVGGQKFRYEPL